MNWYWMMLLLFGGYLYIPGQQIVLCASSTDWSMHETRIVRACACVCSWAGGDVARGCCTSHCLRSRIRNPRTCASTCASGTTGSAKESRSRIPKAVPCTHIRHVCIHILIVQPAMHDTRVKQGTLAISQIRTKVFYHTRRNITPLHRDSILTSPLNFTNRNDQRYLAKKGKEKKRKEGKRNEEKGKGIKRKEEKKKWNFLRDCPVRGCRSVMPRKEKIMLNCIYQGFQEKYFSTRPSMSYEEKQDTAHGIFTVLNHCSNQARFFTTFLLSNCKKYTIVKRLQQSIRTYIRWTWNTISFLSISNCHL